MHARAGGVGPRCSTKESSEQRGASRGGGRGGKTSDQGERQPDPHQSGTERGTGVTRFGRRAACRETTEKRKVHNAAPSLDGGAPRRQLLQIETGSGDGSGWGDLEGV